MIKLRKILGISVAILGVAFMYIASAFVIPFPTEFLTLGIATILPGGTTVENMKKCIPIGMDSGYYTSGIRIHIIQNVT